MPGNLVVINGSNDLEWYVRDENMDLLIALLDVLGHKTNEEDKEEEEI